MDELNERAVAGQTDMRARIAEISRLFVTTRKALDHMIKAIGAPDGDAPTQVTLKLNELLAAHQAVLAAEETFDAQQGKSDAIDGVDLDAIRTEIGGQLDRIRAAILADKISFDT